MRVIRALMAGCSVGIICILLSFFPAPKSPEYIDLPDRHGRIAVNKLGVRGIVLKDTWGSYHIRLANGNITLWEPHEIEEFE